MNITKKQSYSEQSGFTIIELLIATAVLSVILVMVSAMMIGISHLYYKGITQSSVQDNARTVTDQIAQDIKLAGASLISSSVAPGDDQSYCMGTTRYSFVLGRQLSDNPTIYQSYHVLWRDSVTAGTCPSMPASTLNSSGLQSSDPSGTELIGQNSMLTEFSITSVGTVGSVFTVSIGEAEGNPVLLCDSGTPGDCNSINNSVNVWDPNAATGKVICKGLTGSQLCATDYLTTTVSERI